MSLASDGAIMVLVFKTANNPQVIGQGFKLQYTFETDYRLGTDGILQPGGCNFLYKSSTEKKSGNFMSSRYPSSYPAQITCNYEFRPALDEQVMLVFQNFRLLKESKYLGAPNLLFKSYELNATLDILNGYGDDACFQDYVEIYELPFKGEQSDDPQNTQRAARSANRDEDLAKNQKLFSLNFDNLIDDQVLDSDRSAIQPQERWAKPSQDSSSQTKIGRWCSRSAPGPIVSSRAGSILKVIFKTDLTGFQSGFLGIYSFKPSSTLADRCDYKFSTDSDNPKLFGSIASPNWPNPYKSVDELCNWTVKVRKGFRVLLQFQHFSIEGDMRGGLI